MITATDSLSATTHRTSPATERFLRTVLKLDAVVTGANGLAYLALAPAIHALLGLPVALQRPVGAFLLVYGLAVGAIATRPVLHRGAVAACAALNALWVVASLAALFEGALPGATTLGAVWVIAQALVVGGFAALQAVGLRR